MKRLLVLMLAVALLAGSSLGLVTFGYDAGPAGGGPADIDPVLQGWSTSEVDDSSGPPLQNVFYLQPDGTTGFNATQLNDQQGTGNPSPNDNPNYLHSLTTQNHQDMFDNGWEYEARFRPVEGGGFSGWGWSGGNGSIWGSGTSRDRFGIGVGIDTNDMSTTIGTQDGFSVNMGPASANSYTHVLAVGIAGTSTYDLYIDGVWQITDDLLDGGSNSSYDDKLRFESGSSGGTGRVVNWNQVRLTAIPEPGTIALFGLGLGAMLLRRRRA